MDLPGAQWHAHLLYKLSVHAAMLPEWCHCSHRNTNSSSHTSTGTYVNDHCPPARWVGLRQTSLHVETRHLQLALWGSQTAQGTGSRQGHSRAATLSTRHKAASSARCFAHTSQTGLAATLCPTLCVLVRVPPTNTPKSTPTTSTPPRAPPNHSHTQHNAQHNTSTRAAHRQKASVRSLRSSTSPSSCSLGVPSAVRGWCSRSYLPTSRPSF